MPLPDPAASRAVLIGVGRYRSLPELPHVARNLADLRTLLTGPASWNLPETHCTVLAEPSSQEEVLDAIRAAAAQATDTLLVYFAGHGLVDTDTDELFLGLPNARTGYAYTGIEYRHLRPAVLRAPSLRRVVVLDCCYSGLAANAMSGGADLASHAKVEGVCLLAAAHAIARAEEGERNTAFTGELLRVLDHGVADGPALIDLNTLYEQARARLVARGLPEPQKSDLNTAGSLGVARNPAYRPDLAKPERAAEPEPEADPDAEEPAVRYVRRNRGGHMLLLVAVLFGALPAFWSLVAYGDVTTFMAELSQANRNGQSTDGVYARVPDVVFSSSLLLAALAGWLGVRRFLEPYGLEVSAHEVVLVRGKPGQPRRRYRYAWHRISEARLAWSPHLFSRTRGTYYLVLKLLPDTPKRSYLFLGRARASRRLGGVIAADVSRLECTPEQLGKVLERFGGPVWKLAPDTERPPPDASRRQSRRVPAQRFHRTTRRARLAVLAFLLAAVAATPATLSLTGPQHLSVVDGALLGLWTLLLSVPVLPPAVCAWFPAALTLDAAGLTYVHRGRTAHWPWNDVAQVGVVSWRRGRPANGALFVRPADLDAVGRALPRGLPWLVPRLGGVIVCDLFSFGVRRAEVEAALECFAPHAWDSHARPEHGITCDDEDGARFEGSTPSWRTLAACVASACAVFALVSSSPPHGRDATLLLLYTCFVAVFPVPFFVRDRFALILDRQALTLRVRGRSLDIPWEDIHRVTRRSSDLRDPARNQLVVWLREGAASRYRRVWRFYVARSGGELRVLLLDAKDQFLPLPRARVDAALKRFAGDRFR
ncbi:caspase family protein [Streptomyces sp. BR123]|uniref:caspase, EACC1-associated type n=1 Tax=Streptomyces sp. BR123 TaxID=2749828 RepID=UPI0015C48F77|nr:caspase family protein [Streptomyces sp. BR123]NXY98879.1 caspase family protein [Streptomyces sp. BR123]